MEAGTTSCKTLDENGEQNTRCVIFSQTLPLCSHLQDVLCLLSVRLRIECFKGPTSMFRKAFCHPAHHSGDLSPLRWEVGVDTDRIVSEMTFL